MEKERLTTQNQRKRVLKKARREARPRSHMKAMAQATGAERTPSQASALPDPSAWNAVLCQIFTSQQGLLSTGHVCLSLATRM